MLDFYYLRTNKLNQVALKIQSLLFYILPVSVVLLQGDFDSQIYVHF